MRRKAVLGIRQLTREHAEYRAEAAELRERVRLLEGRIDCYKATELGLRDRIAYLSPRIRRGAA